VLRSCVALILVLLALDRTEASSSAWIPVSASWRYDLITTTVPQPNWMRPDFDDSSWSVGRAGFSVGRYGYDEAATLLPSSVGNLPVHGLMLRHSWVIEDPGSAEMLTLRVDYQDGLIGWLNGTEIFRRGFPTHMPLTGLEVPVPRYSGEVEWIDLTLFRDRLVQGTNVLALMSLDAGSFSPTLYVWPELRANFIHGPLVQNVGVRSAEVCWRTVAPRRVWVEYGLAAGGSVLSRIGGNDGAVESLRLTGLSPGTRYRYRVGWDSPTGGVASSFFEFSTLTESGDVRFLVVGDTGSGSLAQYSIASAMASEKADFVLHTGDICYPQFSREQVELRCFGVYEPQMRQVPYFFTVGNHDFYRGDAAYLEAFRLPTNSVTGTEHFYSFDHGDVHCVSLFVPWVGVSQFPTLSPDGMRSLPFRWLTNDLAQSTKPWKIVFFHQPLRTSGPHILDDYDVNGRGDVLEIQDALLPALAAHGVDLVMNGHDHAWERFAPTNGVHSVVTGGGGAVLYPAYRRDEGSTRYAMRHHYARVQIIGAEMQIEAVAPSGEVFDAFTIRRRRSGTDVQRIVSTVHSVPSTQEGIPNGDGNQLGETFDLVGEGVSGVAGMGVNPGRLVVNHDMRQLHLGLRDLAIWPGQTMMLFLETPDTDGVTRCAGVGSIRQHPLNGLNLEFLDFKPGWVFLLGDEGADATSVDFRRTGSPKALGQGVFRLNAGLEPAFGSQIRQFNQSPETGLVVGEENANFIQISVAREWIGAGRVGASVRLAAVVATPISTTTGVRLVLDTAFHGAELKPIGPEAWVLRPIEIVLGESSLADRDGDGLEEERERILGTDPDHPDTDRDGLLDGWEIQFGLDPRQATGMDGADGDVDSDGYSNLEEFRSGTNPRDASPTFRASVHRRGTELRLTWQATVGRRYAIEAATRLPGPFEAVPLGGFPKVAENPREAVRLEPSFLAQGYRWYRIRELAP